VSAAAGRDGVAIESATPGSGFYSECRWASSS